MSSITFQSKGKRAASNEEEEKKKEKSDKKRKGGTKLCRRSRKTINEPEKNESQLYIYYTCIAS